MSTFNFDEAVQAYVMLRDHVDQQEKALKEKLSPLREKMKDLESAMRDQLQESGTKSAKTGHGTCYLSEVSSAKVTDMNEVLEYVKANDRYDLLERRVSKAVVEEIGEVPGVALTRVLKLNVRRS